MLKILNQIPLCFFVMLAMVNVYRFRNRLRDNDNDFLDKESSGNAVCLLFSIILLVACLVGMFKDFGEFCIAIKYPVLLNLVESISPTAIKELPKDRVVSRWYKIRLYIGQYVTFGLVLLGVWEIGKGMY